MTLSEPVISIIVPTRNRKELLHRQIGAVLSQGDRVDWELIVVDNGSTDGTVEAVQDLARADSRVRLIVATEQADAAYARNVGAVVARADRLAFIDDDDVVGEGWLEAINQALKTHPLVAPRIDYTLLNAPAVVDGWPKTQAQSLLTLDGREICTGHVGITAALWHEIGGQRSGFLVGEDAELSIRASRDLGVQPAYTPTAVYHRQLPTTLRGSFRQGRRDGRGGVQREVIDHGKRRVTRVDLRNFLSSWWWLFSRAPLAAFGIRRYLWTMKLGAAIGRLEQSLRMRVLLP